jgi:hypothetical protein
MPSMIADVVREAAGAVAREHHVDIAVNPPNPRPSECAAGYGEHRAALVQLLTVAVEMATAPRSLRLVIYPEAPPITGLYIRGTGVPTMFEAIPEEHRAGLVAGAAAIKQISARLFRDPGGLLVLYGKFSDDDQ